MHQGLIAVVAAWLVYNVLQFAADLVAPLRHRGEMAGPDE